MKIVKRTSFKAIILIITAVCLLGFSGPVIGFTPPPLPKQTDEMMNIRQAGLHKIHAQVPTILKALKNPPHPYYKKTGLHALAQLGDVEALPVIEDFIQDTSDADMSNYARVAKARLLAESSVSNFQDTPAETGAKINRFYQELAVAPDSLNSAALTYQKTAGQWHRSAPPTEVYAMREIADMLYQRPSANAAPLPGVALVNFQLDDAAALKVRLTPLSEQDRIVTLIQELAHEKIQTSDESYKIQLLIDEGPIASHAAAAELARMDAHRAQYDQITYHNGFVSLFYVIAGIGDKEQVTLLRRFSHDADGAVAHYAAIAASDLEHGSKYQYAPGY